MNCYIFWHPQYGKIRVVERNGALFYYLRDVMKIFSKRGAETFQIIANSEGEVVEFSFIMAPPKARIDNFFTEGELQVTKKRKKNFLTDKIFIDEQLLQDMEVCKSDRDRLAVKWINLYISRVVSSDATTSKHQAIGVEDCFDHDLLSPMDISYTRLGLRINHEYLEI